MALLDLTRRTAIGAMAGLATASVVTAGSELRAVWLHMESRFSSDEAVGRKQIQDTCRDLAATNFNTLFVLAWSGYLTAVDEPQYQTRHRGAAWDMFSVLLAEARTCGLAVHLWYSFVYDLDAAPAPFDPTVGGDPAWAVWSVEDLAAGKPSIAAVCPMHSKARAWHLRLLSRAVKRYPEIRGLHMEEPGYTWGRRQCVCQQCQRLFQELYDLKLIDSLSRPEASDFRTIGTSAFIEQVGNICRANRTRLILSTNGAPDWKKDRNLGRDNLRWAQCNLIDFFVPQVYSRDSANVRNELISTLRAFNGACPIVCGIAVNWSGGTNSISDVTQQIDAIRGIGSNGISLFSYDRRFFSEDFRQSLKATVFKNSTPSLSF